jgi:hypothetical protein
MPLVCPTNSACTKAPRAVRSNEAADNATIKDSDMYSLRFLDPTLTRIKSLY